MTEGSKGTTMYSERDASRAERILRIRREIAAGVYETPNKLEAALDRFLDRHAADGHPADHDEPRSDPTPVG